MGKRGRKKKFKLSFNLSSEALRSIFAVLLILAGIMVFISFIAGGYPLNAKIQLIFRKIFGLGAFITPIILIISGLLFIDALKIKIKEFRIIVGLVILLASLSSFLHLFIKNVDAKSMAIDGRGGGYLGYLISSALKSTVSVYGAFFILVAFVVVALILIFNISFDQILNFFGSIKIFNRDKKEKVEDEIDVTPGMASTDNSQIDFAENAISIENELAQAEFEIIPSMSEPQTGYITPEMAITQVRSGLITPTSVLGHDKLWELPPLELLDDAGSAPPDTGDIEENKKIIVSTLKSFDIPSEVVDCQIGPTFTKYILECPPGVRVAKISNLQQDLALAVASPTGAIRIEAPIPGKKQIGIEVPNKKRANVNFKSLITSEQMKSVKSKLAVVLGKDVGGMAHVYDIVHMPHLLIAGTTGSGKSVFIHNLIFSILYRATPQEVKFIMVDPKRVELADYRDIPHLFTPLVTDIDKVPSVFKWSVAEMARRYKMFEVAKARNIEVYNEKSGFQALPYIVIIIDELAQIMLNDKNGDIEKSIKTIAQLARATGIHLILAAQRPSTDVITGVLKANIPCRVAFNVMKQVDSRVIIDQSGAEKLLGRGDMLFIPPDKPYPVRLQSAYISDKEISNLVSFVKKQGIAPDYNEEIISMPTDEAMERSITSGGRSLDPLYHEAADIIISAGKASASLLQRRLSIGYARAARILDELQENGVVGPAQGSRPRDILLHKIPLPGEIPIEDDPQALLES